MSTDEPTRRGAHVSRRVIAWLAALAVGGAIGAGIGLAQPPLYTSAATVRLVLTPDSGSQEALLEANASSLAEARRLAQSMLETSPPGTAVFALAYTPRPATGAAEIHVSAQSADPTIARRAATELARDAAGAADLDVVQLAVVSRPASRPDAPSYPLVGASAWIGATLALVVVVGAQGWFAVRRRERAATP